MIFNIWMFVWLHSGGFQRPPELLVLRKVHDQLGRPVLGQRLKRQSHIHLEGTLYILIRHSLCLGCFQCVFFFKPTLTFQISDPQHPPMLLQGHSEEVTSVAWCPTDFTKVRRQAFLFLRVVWHFRRHFESPRDIKPVAGPVISIPVLFWRWI